VGLQERIEATRAGRVVISAVIVVLLLAVVIGNLPDSALQRDASPYARPLLLATGLDQSWSVFAPDPRSQVIDLQALVGLSDGTGEIWRIPTGGPFVGAYWDYRWRKFEEQLIADAHSELWPAFAGWVAARGDGRSRVTVSRVELVRRFYDLNAPGRHPAHSPWRSFTFYTLVPRGTAR